MMRGLCRYLIGRLVTFNWESQTGRAQSLLFRKDREAHSSVQAGVEAGLSG